LDKKQFPWEQEGFAEFRAWIAANRIVLKEMLMSLSGGVLTYPFSYRE
jgi:hypothetical protein